MGSRKPRRSKGDAPPSIISARVTPEQYRRLTEMIDGRMTMSEFILERAFGAGPRDTTVLQHIHALAQAGVALRKLVENGGCETREASVLLTVVRGRIDKLARLVP